MTDHDQQAISPCKCGGVAELMTYDNEDHPGHGPYEYAVRCQSCRDEGIPYDTASLAITWWNAYVAPAQSKPAADPQPAAKGGGEDVAVSGKEIAEFQDDVRAMLLDELKQRGIHTDIDGGGCDSGDWRDFTMSEIRQGFNRLADHYYDVKAADDGAASALAAQITSLTTQRDALAKAKEKALDDMDDEARKFLRADGQIQTAWAIITGEHRERDDNGENLAMRCQQVVDERDTAIRCHVTACEERDAAIVGREEARAQRDKNLETACAYSRRADALQAECDRLRSAAGGKVVKLPRPVAAPPYPSYESGWNECLDEVLAALHAANVEVQP